jgi:hypothetical protein
LFLKYGWSSDMIRTALVFQIIFIVISWYYPGTADAGDSYSIVDYGALSPAPTTSPPGTPEPDILPTSQWEVSATALAGSFAANTCGAGPDNPTVFLQWANTRGPTNPKDFNPPYSFLTNDQRILKCPLSDFRLCPDIGAPANTVPLAAPYSAESNDSIIGRLADGRLVSVFQTIKRCTASTPAPVDVTGGKGGEGCLYMCGNAPGEGWDQVAYVSRVSQDCGTTWTRSVLDVRDIARPTGVAEACAGDRVEMYADPFSGNLFMATSIGKFNWDPFDNKAGIILTTPMPVGVTAPNWTPLYELPTNVAGSGSEFLAMTSMPHSNGVSRMYWLTCHLSRPIFYFADSPWGPGQGLSGPHYLDSLLWRYDGSTSSKIGDYACVGTNKAPDWTMANKHVIRNILGNYGIARISTDGKNDKLRVIYQQQNPITAGLNDMAYSTFRIVDLDVNEINASPPFYATSIMTIPSASNISAIYPSIIQVDQPTAFDPNAATHLLHWTEVNNKNEVREKVMAWDPDGWKPEREVSASPWTCAKDCTTGDYQYGSFIDTPDRCTHRFFVPYGVASATGTLTHGAIVTTYNNEFLNDTFPPTGSFTINNNALYTTNPAVTLNMNASDAQCAVREMCSANNTSPLSCSVVGWEPYQTTKTWTLASGDGTQTVYARFKDSSGNVSAWASDSIVLDTTPPSGTFALPSGKPYACTSPVSFGVTCNDSLSGCNQARYRVLSSGACGLPGYPICPRFNNWEPIATWSPSKALILATTPLAASYSTVEVQYSDTAGNLSNTYAYQLLLGRAPNATVLAKPANGASSVIATPTLIWNPSFGAENYDLQLCSDSACSTVVSSWLSLATTQWTVPSTLIKGTTYYWRVRAKNGCGTPTWSNIWSFTTVPILPMVSTAPISGVTVTAATSGGTVSSDGGASVTARGVCWSTTLNPTLTDSHTTDGTGTGAFSSAITGINPNTTYHVRAYATNNAGTAYGNDIPFSASFPFLLFTKGAANYHASFAAAYAAAVDGDIIKIMEGILDVKPVLNRNISLTLKGGFDTAFSTQPGYTSFLSPTIIGRDRVIFDRIIIK